MARYRKPAALALAVALAAPLSIVHAENLSPKLRINGFATASASWVTDDYNSRYHADAFIPGTGIDENGNFTDDNVLGVQLAYVVDDRFDLVGQLVAKGRQNYETNADWAYVAFKANDQLRIRAGRFAAPFFLFSENRNVGQAYPWVRPPVELYGAVPLDSLDGADILFRQPVGDWNLDAQLSLGGSRDDISTLSKAAGLNLAVSNDKLTVRAGYTQGKLDLTLGKNPFGNSTEQLGYLMSQFGVDLDMREGDASFADIGALYDDGNWLVATEFGQLRLDRYLSDLDAGYLTVGHYFGKWLPYVMYSKSNTVQGDECLADLGPAFVNAPAPMKPTVAAAIYATCAGSEQTSYSAGVRYDATKQVSIKLELDHVQDFHNTPGYFSGVVLTDDDSTDVITVNVNAAF